MKKILSYCMAAAVGVMFWGCSEAPNNTAAADTVIRSLNQGHKSDSINKLKQIGQFCTMFADDNKGRLPDGLSELLQANSSVKSLLIASYDKKSTPASGSTVKSSNTSYAYLGRGITLGKNNELPVCIEKPWLLPAGEKNIRVLMTDGEVKTWPVADVSGISCEDVIKMMLKGHDNIPEAEKLLQNARRIDSNHKKNN